MELKNYKLSSVQYIVTKCEISAPKLKEKYIVPNDSISEIIIDNDFEKYYYPYFQVNIKVPVMVERALKQTPLEVYMDITIEMQYYSDPTGQQLSPDSISKFISGKYIAYMDNQTRSIMDGHVQDVEDSTGENAKSLNINALSSMRFTLYNDKIIKALSTNINAVISSSNLVNILAFVLTCAGMSNVLLSPPNNNKTYKQFILPPQDAQDHIERICHHYGLHSAGTLIFHGLDRTYMIDRQPKCTAFSTNEYQTTYLYYPGGTGNVNNTGCGKSSIEKSNLLLIQPATFKFMDMTVEAEELLSSDITAITPWSGGGGNGDIAMSIGGDNTTSAVKRQTKAFAKVIEMSFNSIDLTMLTPNKKFTVIMDDIRYKAYTGDYMLTRCTTTLLRTGGAFSPVINCSFKC